MSGQWTFLRYLALFALILILPMLVVASISTYQFAVAESKRLEASVQHISREMVGLVDGELAALEGTLETVAMEGFVQAGDMSGLEKRVREISVRTGEHIVLMDPTGQVLLDTNLPQGSPTPRLAYPDIVREVTGKEHVYFSNLFVSQATGQQQIQISVPVMRGNDVVAILGGIVGTSRLVDVLREGLPEELFLGTILDRNGVVVARTIAGERLIGKPFPAGAILAEGANGEASLISDGVPVFAHYRSSALSGWTIMATVEWAALTAPLTRSLQHIALGAAGLAALAVGGAWWVGRKLTRAHRSLEASAKELGEGRAIAPPRTSLEEANVLGEALAAASRSIAFQADELTRTNVELEGRVEARTRELAAKQALLEEAKEAAEAANRSKTDFLATMSHEMRTPLNAVIGYSELLLRDSNLKGDALGRAERIRNSASALLCLVDEILDLGKIEAGIIDVRAEPFSLSTLINDTVEIVRPSALDQQLEMNVSLETSTGDFFLGDEDRLRQVLLNLLKNAIKFTPSGNVRLTVTESAADEERSLLRFVVSDTGIGIAQAELGTLFQRFHQIDPSLDRRFGGAGLGLAISKQLVERMGGSIGVESDLGKGSTFWFALALERAEAIEPVATKPRGRAASILVAEDVVINQELARELLEAAGHMVEIVSNGVEAVEAVKAGLYDLVLMDLSMPEMDGLTAIRLIRTADVATCATPIVACTANITPARISALSAAGADAFLRKPLRQRELHATVDRILARQSDKVQPDLPATPAQPELDEMQNIVSLVGAKRVIAALDRLTEDLQTLVLVEPADRVERKHLAERVHAIISTASLLELTGLAESCRDVENACHDDTGMAHALERLGQEVGAALAKRDLLRSNLERQAA